MIVVCGAEVEDNRVTKDGRTVVSGLTNDAKVFCEVLLLLLLFIIDHRL